MLQTAHGLFSSSVKKQVLRMFRMLKKILVELYLNQWPTFPVKDQWFGWLFFPFPFLFFPHVYLKVRLVIEELKKLEIKMYWVKSASLHKLFLLEGNSGEAFYSQEIFSCFQSKHFPVHPTLFLHVFLQNSFLIFPLITITFLQCFFSGLDLIFNGTCV